MDLTIKPGTSQPLSPAQEEFNKRMKALEKARASYDRKRARLDADLVVCRNQLMPMVEKRNRLEHQMILLVAAARQVPKMTERRRRSLQDLLFHKAQALLGDPVGLGEEERVRVSIFLSVFDVHIQRAPLAGRIIRSLYVPGAFLNAALDKASEENERRTIVIETATGIKVGVVQIAGLVARRIVTFVAEGDSIGVGERFGLIRFGSRVDTYLPPGAFPAVAIGQRAIGGETVLADLRSVEPEREARRH